MTKARAEALYCRAYQHLYVTNQYCAEWLHARRKMFASFILVGRRGIVTTNSVEQFNRVMLEARESPITDALLILLNKIGNTIVQMLTTAGVKILLTKTSKNVKGDRKIKR